MLAKNSWNVYDRYGNKVLQKETSAYENLGNQIVQKSNMLYFGQLWGESSPTCDRAFEIMKCLSFKCLDKIKHNYGKPAVFGFELREGEDTVWYPYKGFVETVARKEKEGESEVVTIQQPVVTQFRPIVAYLVREGGLSPDFFDPRYFEFANFNETFEILYGRMGKELSQNREDILQMRKNLRAREERWKEQVYHHMVADIQRYRLLDDPKKHFDSDQCASIEMTRPTVLVNRELIKLSSLKADLEKEISRKLDFS